MDADDHRHSPGRGLISPEILALTDGSTMDPLALFRVEGPDRYRHEWIDRRALIPYGWKAQEVVGRLVSEVYPPVSARRFQDAANTAVAERRVVRYIGSSTLDDNRDLEITITPFFADGAAQILTSRRDISDRVAREAEREASNRRLNKLMEHAADAIWLISLDGVLISATGGVERVLGIPADELAGRHCLDLIDPKHRAYAESLFGAVVESTPDKPAVAELPLRHRDGTLRWLECTVTNLLDDPDVGAIVVNSHDVTERKIVEKRLAHEALHDGLTGLPNRALVSRRISSMLHRASGNDLAGVLFIDFDGFKLVNDTLGHDLGDVLIRDAARRLESTVGDRGWVARFGGDEFIVVASDVAPVEHHRALADDLRVALARPFHLNGSPIYLTASIGLATGSPDTGADAAKMLRHADMAMYEAKRRGPDSVQIFDDSLRRLSERRLETRNLLRNAVDDERLLVEYQPIFENATRTIVGVEALLRWNHPVRGIVGPGEFIDIAEETGLILPIGAWVLDRTCAQLAQWNEQGLPRICAAVNVSPRQLLERDFVRTVHRSIARAGIDPAQLVIEITENLIMEDPSTARAVLLELAEAGVHCSIDDFGRGYSSLSYLAEFPATMLKIDRSFVASLVPATHDNGHDVAGAPQPARVRQATAIVAAIIAMAHALGLAVVAEGVETDEQFLEMRRLGCEFAQGYHLGRPMSADGIARLLHEQQRRNRARAANTTSLTTTRS